MWLIAWVLLGLCLGGLGLAAVPRNQRREHFWWRVAAIPVVPGSALCIACAFTPVWKMQPLLRGLAVLAIPAVILLPALLYRPSGPPPGSSGDDGGGSGREPPSPPPTRPRGGIPLPDAEQAGFRVRDHNRPRLTQPGARRPHRPAREPRRAPAH